MAECDDHENCAANEEIRSNSRLENEISKCQADNRKRGFQLFDQLKQIKQLDEQIYRKQMTLHLPSSCVAQNHAADSQVEQDPDEQTTQNHMEQMIAHFEHTIHKATKEEEENDEKNEMKNEEENDEKNEMKDEEENYEKNETKDEEEENDKENEKKDEKDKEEKEEKKTKDGKQIPASDFGDCAVESINDICSFHWSNSKSPNNECSGGVEELIQGVIDNKVKLTSEADFKSKQLHFEKLIQKEIIITEQEINKRRRLLKK